MQNEERLTPAERELEAALQGLRPANPLIDRDRFMFLAGQRSVRHRQHAWTGVAAVLAAALVLSITVRSSPRRTELAHLSKGPSDSSLSVSVPAAGGLPPVQGVPGGQVAYLKLRDDVLVRGVEVMPTDTIRSAAITEPSPRSERLLDTSSQRRQRWGFFGLEKLISVGDQI